MSLSEAYWSRKMRPTFIVPCFSTSCRTFCKSRFISRRITFGPSIRRAIFLPSTFFCLKIVLRFLSCSNIFPPAYAKSAYSKEPRCVLHCRLLRLFKRDAKHIRNHLDACLHVLRKFAYVGRVRLCNHIVHAS